MANQYDENNIFAKILRGEIPCSKVFENDYVLAFNDINPKKNVHILVIPKNAYVSLDDFSAKATDAEQAAILKAISTIANEQGITNTGYRVITNVGSHGGQEVPHFHFHILGGEIVGKLVG